MNELKWEYKINYNPGTREYTVFRINVEHFICSGVFHSKSKIDCSEAIEKYKLADKSAKDRSESLKIVCDCNKRRKCDSLYIERYNKIAMMVFKSKTKLNELKDILPDEYKIKVNEILDELTEREVNSERND